MKAKLYNKKRKGNVLGIVLITLLFILSFILGIATSQVFFIKTEYILSDNPLQNKEYEGLYSKNNFGFKGDWVHVNVDNIDFSRGIEVCQHECGHAVYSEIYAEKCEKNITKCMENIK